MGKDEIKQIMRREITNTGCDLVKFDFDSDRGRTLAALIVEIALPNVSASPKMSALIYVSDLEIEMNRGERFGYLIAARVENAKHSLNHAAEKT